MSEMLSILEQYWGYKAFRPLQEEIIQSILAGKDTLAVLPTGGGKSLCFQVPAMATEGICLVISPLIALMKDQVENLKKRNIPALLIHSGMQRADVIQTLQNAKHNYFKFLYVSPERLETSLFKEYLPSIDVSLVAVDEAHCISQWGYDFRPSYLRIAELRKELPGVPVLALTASATEAVQKDICEKLDNPEQVNKKLSVSDGWQVYRQSFERKNLAYSVFKVDSKIAKLVDILKKVQGTSIVYCKSRKRTGEIANLLQMHGIAASHYHAGLKTEDRSKRQLDWINNKTRVIVCTNAFGMGIDKPDVRTVIHMDTPDCLENYYQEAGRAGRDGKKAFPVLLYDARDLEELAVLHLVRYPNLEQIRSIYHALCNYLQIPINTGQDKSYTFHFDAFIRNFKLNSQTALYSLKALESDGWLDFNEKNFAPATLVFTTSKKGLYEFQKSHPQQEEILTSLLRTYEGIFDFPGFISELLIAKLLKKDEAEIKKQLKTIASFGIIQYIPQNTEPQIIFRKNRVAAEHLAFNLMQYYKRRDIFIERANQMIAYTQTSVCRSKTISIYFGDANARDCGVCDNCLQKKKTVLSPGEFESIAAMVLENLSVHGLTAEELFHILKGIPKEKAWRVIDFLQAEKRISSNEKGMLILIRPVY
jgi:ATP-dependent DNA helicase RecQ